MSELYKADLEEMSRRIIFVIDKVIEDTLRKRREAAGDGREKAAALYSDFLDSLNNIKEQCHSYLT